MSSVSAGLDRLSPAKTALLPPGPRLPVLLQTLLVLRYRQRLFPLWRNKYGRMFTVTLAPGARRTVVVADPAIVREVFAGNSTVFHPGWGNEVLRPVMGDRSVLVLNEEEHLATRRRLLPALHGSALSGYVDVIRELTANEIRHWPAGQPLALQSRMNALSLDVILRVVFGVDTGARLDELRALLSQVLAVDGVTLLCGSYDKLRKLGRWRKFEAVLKAADAVLYAEIADRRAEHDLAGRHDVLSRMLNEDPEVTDLDVRDQLMTLLLAGYDTTGTAIAWALYEMARRPAVLAVAQAAADEGDLAYLTAAFKESVRLRPVFYEVARTLTAPVELGGWQLPAGTSVMPAIGVVHSDPSIHDAPEEFRPERFLANPPSSGEWIPFGGGVRRCLGAGFAQAEAIVIMQEVLRSYDLRPASSRRERYRSQNVTFSPARGAQVVLSPRGMRSKAGETWRN
ncbi:cytochrome P450 [Amycolatopsis pithecellobii]|uniref:Cytochrome P450 n=1 Tax=Amycolatopsis pithecellobii TaxID=664692 RepID=A0A6N7ZCL5_9PSEU|nr:cytochrome P450 [Amycolatopsis pithecellobii]MTD59534.1 cytochrome P450 [Amycolatopsis pithecellobii]